MKLAFEHFEKGAAREKETVLTLGNVESRYNLGTMYYSMCGRECETVGGFPPCCIKDRPCFDTHTHAAI